MRIAVAYGLLLLASACSWFSKDDEGTKPAELTPIKAEVTLTTVWDRRIGGEAEDRASQLVPLINGSRVFAASADGNVMALEEGTGRIIWEINVRNYYSSEERALAFAPKSDVITGGVGGGGDIIVVGTFGGEILGINQSDGTLAWRSKVTSEVLAQPQVNQGLVVVQSIDSKVAAYDALDGTRRWVYSASSPSLTLRGTATPIVTSDFIVAGFANGRIVVLDRERGLAGIDRRVGVAQGKSDLERLVDVDGTMVVSNNVLYAVGYQGSFLCLDISDGRVRWQVEASSTAGLAEGFGNVYIAYASGKVAAIDIRNGRALWETDALKNRELSTPVTISSYLMVGDLDGYMHLIAQSDGRFVGRRKIDGDPIRTPVVVSGARVYYMSRGGRLTAYELR